MYVKKTTLKKARSILHFGFAIASTLQMTNLANARGFEVGNGGDAIQCSGEAPGQLAGIYALDYVLSPMATAVGQQQLAKVSSFEESTARILKILQEKNESLAADFEIFFKNFLNTNDFSREHIWEPVAYSLVDLKDEQLVGNPPEECITFDENGHQKVIQAVIRTHKNISGSANKKRIFKYVPEVLESLKKQDAVQLSFLLVHEWLWDYSHNLEINRRVTSYFHSKEFATHTAEQFKKKMLDMMFPVPTDFPEGFEKTECNEIPLSKEEVSAKIPDFRMIRSLGEIRTRVFHRDTCPENFMVCDRTWKPFSFYLPPELKEGTKAYLWYADRNFYSPIKIINPGAVRDGEYGYGPEEALLSCSIPETGREASRGKFTTRCEVHPDLKQKLKTPYLRFKGEITENCLSLEGKGYRKVLYDYPDVGSGEMEIELKFLVHGRLKWPY